MYSTFGNSRLPVICVGSSSRRSCALPACAAAGASGLGAVTPRAAAFGLDGLDGAPARVAESAFCCEAREAGSGAAVAEVSTPGSSWSGRDTSRAGMAGCAAGSLSCAHALAALTARQTLLAALQKIL